MGMAQNPQGVASLSRGHDGALAVGQYPVEGARWADEGTDVAKEVAHHPEAQGQGRNLLREPVGRIRALMSLRRLPITLRPKGRVARK